MRTFLHVLREELVGILRRLRAFTLRLAGRSRFAETSHQPEPASSVPAAPVQGTAAADAAHRRVFTASRASLGNQGTFPRSFKLEADAVPGAGPDRGRQQDGGPLETGREPSEKGPRADGLASAVDGEREGPGDEAATSVESSLEKAESAASPELHRAPPGAALEPLTHLTSDDGISQEDVDDAAIAQPVPPSDRGLGEIGGSLPRSFSEPPPPRALIRGEPVGAPEASDVVPGADEAQHALPCDSVEPAGSAAGAVKSAEAGESSEVGPQLDGEDSAAGAGVGDSAQAVEPETGAPMRKDRDVNDGIAEDFVAGDETGAQSEPDGIDISGAAGDQGEEAPVLGGGAEDLDAEFLPTPAEAGRRAPASVRRRERPQAEAFDRRVVISEPPLEGVDYLLWNRTLARHCLLADDGDDDLYLTITPRILAAALSEVQPGRQLPEDAEAAFVGAVAAVYHGRVVGHRQRLHILRRCAPDGLPDCIAFLAASVLAAYRMHSDEEAAATAYYMRLAELLKCDLVGGHPRGFDPEEFEALWRFLEAWLREKGRRLAMPGPAAGLRRFVALPLMHVPLRRVDIERLPEFFGWAGYEPGARIARSKLDEDLANWSLGRSVFTNAGMAALADDRRGAVLAQVAHELESWDGSHTDSLGRRSARVEVLLDIVQGRPELFYLPRRPATFPQVFDDGVHALEAFDEGWYDPVRIPSEDGRDLVEGFAWEVVAGRFRLVLLRQGARAIALPESEYTGYVSRKALQFGARGAALCCDALAEQAADYLSEISQQRCAPLRHPNVPEGWQLFVWKRTQRPVTPPEGLEELAVEAAVDLIPAGGLRLGSRWAWLAGAPPRLIVAGLGAGETVTLDGKPITVTEDGTLAADGHLWQPGVHIVDAGGLRRTIEIVEAEVRNPPREPVARRAALALPRGSWTVLGAVPGEVVVPAWQSRAGAVASCTFTPVWAVEAAAGPGARVLRLCAKPPSPGRPRSFPTYGRAGRSLLAWTSAIYNAEIRRPRMASLHGDDCGAEGRSAWTEYTQVARGIKRRLRKARR